MGIVYLFAYLLGGLAIALGSSHLLDAILENESIISPLKFLAFGGFFVLAGGILQAVVAKRRGNDGLLGVIPPMNAKGAAFALTVWFLPLIWAWAQFEMFMNPIDVYPFISMAGAMMLAFGLGGRIAKDSPMRAAVGMMFVAFLGMPMGLLLNGLTTSHFNYHMSDVRTSSRNPTTYETKTFINKADDPEFLHEESALGDETSALLEMLASAETIDVNEEIAAGRMRIDEHGEFVVLNPDGTDAPMGTADDLVGSVDEAFKADEAAADIKRAKAREAFNAELEERRKGGRLFR